MKLLNKYILVFLLTTLLIFLLGGFVFYNQLQNIISEEANEELYLKKEQFLKSIEKKETLSSVNSENANFSIEPITEKITETIVDTSIYVEEADEFIPYRKLIFNATNNNQFYKVSISKSLFESDDLIETIIQSLLIIAAFLIVIIIGVNYIFAKTIWKPFFKTINKINTFDINGLNSFEKENSSVKEFQELNKAIENMTKRILTDYENIKMFSENASHEMQTPISVIRTSIENMLQSENITEKEISQLESIENAVKKLSSLNKSLLLLTKIENNQFKETKNINISDLSKNLIEQYAAIYESKKISVNTTNSDLVLNINPHLAEILISNIISNAFKHTNVRGEIKIEIIDNQFKIANSGAPLKISENEIFQRFKKNEETSDSIGLGLSIVNSIIDLYNYKINYSYTSAMHTITVDF